MKNSQKAENLARRIGAELGITISADDPILSLMVFQEQQTEQLAEEFKKNQVDFLKSLTEKLIKVGKPKRTTTLITTLIIANITLTIFCVILGLERVWTN
jgi:preprotein translocase subunit SecE